MEGPSDADPWEPYGTNRGGKGASRGRPLRELGPEGLGAWRHDLFGEVAPLCSQEDPSEPSWLPPRGVGSGRGAPGSGGRGSSGQTRIEVSNLGASASAERLRSLFEGCAAGLSNVWVDASRGSGGADFRSVVEARKVAQRFHRHPWMGGRPMNVRLVKV